MIPLYVILLILTVHLVADFVFQDVRWAFLKSTDNNALLAHTSMYSLFWLSIIPFLGAQNGTLFVVVTFFCHTATDYVTSRIVKRKFDNKEFGSPIPNFGAFTIIGIDQCLHMMQLFLTYYFLK